MTNQTWSRRTLNAVNLLVVLAAVLALTACSPEASRTRGGGPGADVGNRQANGDVDMHGKFEPLFGTPPIGQAINRSK